MRRSAHSAVRQRIRAAIALPGLLAAILALPTTPAEAATLPQGFADETVWSGLTNPVNIEFAPDGKVFVAEKGGEIKVFDSISDTTPAAFGTGLAPAVHDFWDRGMLGLAIDPQFPARPYVYVLYTYDHILGSSSPPSRWGDGCPDPPGATDQGCVVSGRLSRLTADATGRRMVAGSERVLVEDWCQQFPSHSVGDLAFGADGALYVSGGDGASFNYVDHGQTGNPCGDPMGGAGIGDDEGGALRSQDRRTAGDPVTLDGTVIRIAASTLANLPSGTPALTSNAGRIVATGMRNPFRITPGRAPASSGSATSAGAPGRRSTGSGLAAPPRTSAGLAMRAVASSPATATPTWPSAATWPPTRSPRRNINGGTAARWPDRAASAPARRPPGWPSPTRPATTRQPTTTGCSSPTTPAAASA